MNKKALLALGVTVLLTGLMVLSVSAAVGTRADLIDSQRPDLINRFNVGPYTMEDRATAVPDRDSDPALSGSAAYRQPLGSALSPELGTGPGVSIDVTYEDIQWWRGNGLHITHWYNGNTSSPEVSVHFGYWEQQDTAAGAGVGFLTGYNMYDATVTSNNWPRGQDDGCDLQAADTLGTGGDPSLDMMANGLVVIGTRGRFYRSRPDGTRFSFNQFLYQGSPFNCTFDPRSSLNVSWIDTLNYQDEFMNQDDGNYGRDPHVATQWDGSNTIVHVLLLESNETALSGSGYADGGLFKTFNYYRKVGDNSYTGTWSAGQILDSTSFFWVGFAAAPYPYTGVATVHCAESYYGGLLNNDADVDIWCRESFDRGISWEDSYSITNYTNAIADHPNHFTAWLESGCMFDSEGDLHAYWCAKPTSADPYFDGFNWNDFDENLYHWEKNNDQVVPGTGDIIKVANGNFMNSDMLTGSMNTVHCGFGSYNVGYLGYATMGQCDDKLYLVWGQIHERANRFPWRDVAETPVPGVLDDCSVVGQRLAMANWELMMSVAKLETSSLWDYPRNISNTYTPNCGIIGWEGHEDATGPCGSEWKPSLENFALDETGLSLNWPAEAVVDLSPGGDYAGGWYLNMQYLDDQFPGPADWGDRDNPPFTLNSMKWVRLACVEPIEASQIRIMPEFVDWPEWVELGQVNNITVTVVNEGNVMLNVTEIGTDDGGGGWLSVTEFPTPATPFQVTAGVVNTATFDMVIDATGIGSTAWLDGEIWVKSDAANFDSVGISIHVLAAAEVEAMVWDTVMTHENMFDLYLIPEGECVALAVGNAGDLGWGAGSGGAINLDYVESELECGIRNRDAFYLIGASPFTIIADDVSGTNAVLTQSFNDPNQADETGFDPINSLNGSLAGGVGTSSYNGNQYDSVYTGKFVNRDTSIAFERIVYGPRSADPANETINFVINYTKVYSADGAPHNHVTIGNVVDWDIPAEQVPNNTTGVSSAGGFVYMQGTDTTGVLSCQANTRRYGTEAFGGGYTSVEWLADNCADGAPIYGVNALIQTLMVDTTHTRGGVPLDPDQPLADVWWSETAVPGLNADATVQDQAIWTTYVYDFNLSALDTLHYWTVLSTVRNGTLANLEAQVNYAKNWFTETIRGCETGCCVGRVGDANGLGGDEPTIGDVSVLIDAKFITGTCTGIVSCLAEGDINQSGGPDPLCGDITIGDISTLIDYLFITGPSLGLNACL